jgi:small nuclear ribonucleoprotein (snRNP)-like protein
MHVQAFDQHLNMILGEVEEVVTTHEIDEETDEEIVKVWFISLDCCVGRYVIVSRCVLCVV